MCFTCHCNAKHPSYDPKTFNARRTYSCGNICEALALMVIQQLTGSKQDGDNDKKNRKEEEKKTYRPYLSSGEEIDDGLLRMLKRKLKKTRGISPVVNWG